jgi:two-component system chemotaxis response regulator CheY
LWSPQGSARDREKGLALGANEYLVKPIDPNQFRSLVIKYLGLNGPAAESPEESKS